MAGLAPFLTIVRASFRSIRKDCGKAGTDRRTPMKSAASERKTDPG